MILGFGFKFECIVILAHVIILEVIGTDCYIV